MSSENETKKAIKREWVNLSKRNLLVCAACGLLINNPKDITYDHYLARSLGGKTDRENGRPMHAACNHAKANLPIDVWEANKWKILAKRGIKTVMDYDISKAKINLGEGKVPEFRDYTFEEQPQQQEVTTRKLPKKKYVKRKKRPFVTKKGKRVINRGHKVPKKIVPVKQKTTLEYPYSLGSVIFFRQALDKTPHYEVREGVVVGYSFKGEIPMVLARVLKMVNGKVVPELVEVKPLMPVHLKKVLPKLDSLIPSMYMAMKNDDKQK